VKVDAGTQHAIQPFTAPTHSACYMCQIRMIPLPATKTIAERVGPYMHYSKRKHRNSLRT